MTLSRYKIAGSKFYLLAFAFLVKAQIVNGKLDLERKALEAHGFSIEVKQSIWNF